MADNPPPVIEIPKADKPVVKIVKMMEMEITAFDLSIQCCGKPLGHPARGITKDGYNLNGMSREEAMTIACNSLPMGTKVRLNFKDNRAQYNGVYIVRDTGGMGPGVVDLYMGDFGETPGQVTSDFGRVTVEVIIEEEG